MKFVSQLECRHRIPILENKSRVRPLPSLESSIVGRESHAAGPEPDEAGRWSILWRAASSAHALALADQLVASGTSFLTTIAVARWTNPGQLGVFVIGMTIMVAALAIQDALVIKPYGIQRFQPYRSPTEHAGNSLMLSGLLAIGSAGALAMCALALLLAGADRETVVVTATLAAVLPLVLAREFARRYAFARLEMGCALIIDIAVAGGQLMVLVFLGSTGRLSAATAYLALGGAGGIVAFTWFFLVKGNFAFQPRQLRTTFQESWNLGKWLFLAQMSREVQQSAPYWISSVIAGAAVTGVYAACMTIVAFANPLIFGLGNILMSKSVLAWRTDGGSALRRQVYRDTLLLGSVVGVVCVVILLRGNSLIELLYPGKAFEGNEFVAFVLGLGILAAAMGMPASNALAAMERPRAIVGVGFFGAAVTLGLVAILLIEWGLIGAAFGFFLGNAVGLAGRWIAFAKLVPPSSDLSPVVDVLRRVAVIEDAGSIGIRRLGEGDYAIAYEIGGLDKTSAATKLALKLYKPEANLDSAAVRAQFSALKSLHDALDGHTVDGWTIRVPRPLYISEKPLALLMTLAPGRDLESTLAITDNAGSESIISAASACTSVMGEYWSRGLLHGDFGLRNILFDIENKTVSLIDPGTPEACSACSTPRSHAPCASLDLGHLLADLGTDIADLIGAPALRLSRHLFSEAVIRAYLNSSPPAEQKSQNIAEVWEMFQAHLARNLEHSLSPRGLWHKVIGFIAIRRIRVMLDRLEAESRQNGALHLLQGEHGPARSVASTSPWRLAEGDRVRPRG